MSLVLSWSGGKDSTLALHESRHAAPGRPRGDVVALLTTVTAAYDRISVHGVRRTLLRRQAASLGVPLHEAIIPAVCSNDDYEQAVLAALAALSASPPSPAASGAARPVDGVAFGDLFLEDVRAYRERLLARVALRPVFPLWGRDTAVLARGFVSLGYKAIVVCVDADQLDASCAGRDFDDAFLDDLPAGVDPCGERGEFHTFVWDGPIFATPVWCVRGERVVRDGRFVYCDLLDASNG